MDTVVKYLDFNNDGVQGPLRSPWPMNAFMGSRQVFSGQSGACPADAMAAWAKAPPRGPQVRGAAYAPHVLSQRRRYLCD